MKRLPYLFVFAAWLCVGCNSGPVCLEGIVSSSGLPFAQCPEPRYLPVCDDPGKTAYYEESPFLGLQLRDGINARCNSDEEIVCDNGGEPRCLFNPEI